MEKDRVLYSVTKIMERNNYPCPPSTLLISAVGLSLITFQIIFHILCRNDKFFLFRLCFLQRALLLQGQPARRSDIVLSVSDQDSFFVPLIMDTSPSRVIFVPTPFFLIPEHACILFSNIHSIITLIRE